MGLENGTHLNFSLFTFNRQLVVELPIPESDYLISPLLRDDFFVHHVNKVKDGLCERHSFLLDPLFFYSSSLDCFL